MEFLLDHVELAVALVLIAAIAAAWLARPMLEHLAIRRMARSTYVVFEAHEVHFKPLKKDMERAGWRSVEAEPKRGGANFYRFEKGGARAQELGILVHTGMTETADRREGADLLIKVADHGVV